MLPPKCFTCNKLFADIELYYEAELKTIDLSNSLTPEEKNKQKHKLVDSLGLTRYCCRMRVLTYVDLVDVIV